MFRRVLVVLSVMVVMACAGASSAAAAPTIIRDTEIEAVLREWTAPLLAASGMEKDAVRFVVVQDDQINAFVAGGANIFLYTGLIEKTRTPGELLGVIAHELGHVRSGHLIRSREAMENASYEAMLGTVLGIGAAILTGDGGAGSAVAMGAQSAARSRFMAFSRTQESSADQAALDLLKGAHDSPDGFLSFMQQLESQELLPASQQSEYARTHPMTRDRINAIKDGVEGSPLRGTSDPPQRIEQHRRILAKLAGFIAPEKVDWVYDDRDNSIAARYARAISFYRRNQINQALPLVDGLLKEEPDNAYFHEIKGQILLEFGRIEDAKRALSRAVTLDPGAPLIRILYAQALIEGSENGRVATDVDEAITQLNRASSDESRNSLVHRLLATAYGYQGHESEAKLHLAEEAVLQKRFKDAKRLAESAAGQLKQGSRSWLRSQDILSYIQQADKESDDDQDPSNRG